MDEIILLSNIIDLINTKIQSVATVDAAIEQLESLNQILEKLAETEEDISEVCTKILDSCPTVVEIMEQIVNPITKIILVKNYEKFIATPLMIMFEIFCNRKGYKLEKATADEELQLYTNFEYWDPKADFEEQSTLKMIITTAQQYKVLSDNEQRDLIRRYQNGDIGVKDLLINSNLRLVIDISSRYVISGVPQEDLIQEGTIGLIHALDKYKLDGGASFSTYAYDWITQYIKRLIEENDRIRIPEYMHTLIARYRKKYSELLAIEGRAPTTYELAEAMQLSIETIEKIEQTILIKEPVDLNKPIVGNDVTDTETSIEDFISDPKDQFASLIEKIAGQEIRAILYRVNLTKRQIHAIEYRCGFFGQPLKFREIGEKFGVTGERARQIYNEAISVLKEKVRTSSIKDLMNNSLGSSQEGSNNVTSPIQNEERKLNPKKNNDFDERNLYYLFPNCSKEEVDIALRYISLEYYQALVWKYGEDFMNRKIDFSKKSKEKTILANSATKSLRSIIEKRKAGNKLFSGVYQYFDSYSKEQIKRALEMLEEDEMALLYKRFGPDLENPYSEIKLIHLTAEELRRLKKIRIKITTILEDFSKSERENKTIYQYFVEKGYTIPQIDIVLPQLKPKDIQLLHKKYGPNLKEISSSNEKKEILSEKERIRLSNIKQQIEKKLAKLAKDSFYSIAKFINSQRKDNSEPLVVRNRMIVFLAFGIGDVEPLSIQLIADVFEISTREVRQIIIRALRNYRINIIFNQNAQNQLIKPLEELIPFVADQSNTVIGPKITLKKVA